MCGLADGVLCLLAKKDGERPTEKRTAHGNLPLQYQNHIPWQGQVRRFRRLPGGEKLTNDFDGETHDYTRKEGVVHTEILLPGHAPPLFLTGRFCAARWRKSKKRKTPGLQKKLKLPAP